jgi:hypothetical protein
MEPTLPKALSRLFGEGAAPSPATETLAQQKPPETSATDSTPSTAPPDTQRLLTQAKQHYDQALQAQREGDWARYGDEIKRLGAVLEQMKAK